jgi:transposase
MPTSADTLVRLAKKVKSEPITTPTHLGVDDFALRRGFTYGTILVNLSTHRPIDLLKDRTAETLAQWLRAHPGVRYITRDRSAEYAQGAAEGAPQALQIVDRWHLLKNWREALERALGRVHERLKQRQTASGVIIRPRYKKPRSSSEVAASHMARLRRQARYQEVIERYQQGKGIEKIAKELQMSPITVRKFVRAGAFPERAVQFRRKGQLGPYLPYLTERVQQGCENASLLWREIQAQGFPGGYKMVNIWVREYLEKPGRQSSEREKARRQAFFPESQEEISSLSTRQSSEPISLQTNGQGEPRVEEPLESPRRLVWLLLRDPSSLNQQEQHRLAFLCQEKDIHAGYALSQQFVMMVKKRQAILFDSWLTSCLNSKIPDLQTFAEGLQKEYAPIKAALTLPYSNGPVEGQINKLKFIKRSMFGRGHFDLLR